MPTFVRKNELVISGTFEVEDSPTTQPSTATAVISYKTGSGATASATISLSKDANNVWSGAWDSSAAGEGRVDWVVYCSGGVIAAAEGTFMISANRANTV